MPWHELHAYAQAIDKDPITFQVLLGLADHHEVPAYTEEYCSRYGCSQKDVGRSSGLDDNIICFAGGYAKAPWHVLSIHIN